MINNKYTYVFFYFCIIFTGALLIHHSRTMNEIADFYEVPIKRTDSYRITDDGQMLITVQVSKLRDRERALQEIEKSRLSPGQFLFVAIGLFVSSVLGERYTRISKCLDKKMKTENPDDTC